MLPSMAASCVTVWQEQPTVDPDMMSVLSTAVITYAHKLLDVYHASLIMPTMNCFFGRPFLTVGANQLGGSHQTKVCGLSASLLLTIHD